jgi:hypothetical protein
VLAIAQRRATLPGNMLTSRLGEGETPSMWDNQLSAVNDYFQLFHEIMVCRAQRQT